MKYSSKNSLLNIFDKLYFLNISPVSYFDKTVPVLMSFYGKSQNSYCSTFLVVTMVLLSFIHDTVSKETCLLDFLVILKRMLENIKQLFPQYYMQSDANIKHTIVCNPSIKH